MLRDVLVGFRLVDVFTEIPFAGNQLCVVPEAPAELDAGAMQRLAKEIGFSETTFVSEAGGDRYRMRIFTPSEELRFAGHPTLGTAFVLAHEGRISSPAVQVTTAGEVRVEVDQATGFVWSTHLPPEFGPRFDDLELLGRAAGLAPGDLHPELPCQVVSTGLPHLLVPVRDDGALRRAERNGEACAELIRRSGGDTVYLFVVRGEGDVRARMFDADLGIGEDPATGSAAGPLGAYLAERGLAGLPGRAVVAQGEQVGRPSFIHLDVRSDGGRLEVRVGGGVRLVGEGSFRL